MKNIYLSLFIAICAGFTSCQNKAENTIVEAEIFATGVESTAIVAQTFYQKGDRVPNKEVCMVNDAYMGKLQMEVPFEGKIYYGCCQMCVDRIPADDAVRKAIDPLTLKKIDKATAFIVLAGDKGEVAYFESEKNYREFLQSNKKI